VTGAGRTVARVVAVILLVVGLVGIWAGVALREFVVLAVPLVGGGVFIVVEALHLFFTGRIS
jgi:hypothetical protein